MSELFSYRRQGRRPAVWLAAGCLTFMAATGMLNGAPYPMWILWVMGGLPVIWVLVSNPTDGIVITRDQITLSPWRTPRIVNRADLRRVETHGRGSETEVVLIMRSGDKIEVNPRDLPEGPRLVDAFEKALIPITVR